MFFFYALKVDKYNYCDNYMYQKRMFMKHFKEIPKYKDLTSIKMFQKTYQKLFTL